MWELPQMRHGRSWLSHVSLSLSAHCVRSLALLANRDHETCESQLRYVNASLLKIGARFARDSLRENTAAATRSRFAYKRHARDGRRPLCKRQLALGNARDCVLCPTSTRSGVRFERIRPPKRTWLRSVAGNDTQPHAFRALAGTQTHAIACCAHPQHAKTCVSRAPGHPNARSCV